MRDFHCRDAGMQCSFVARGTTDEEVLTQAGQHAQQAHGMKIDRDLEKKVRGLIHDESSEAHRRSMAAASSTP